jgi:phospholipid/cholesterol/gamma-HCH transport system substrate-binding protein
LPSGACNRIELSPDGNVRILVDVPRTDAHWLRQIQRLHHGTRRLVGSTRSLRLLSGVLTDPPLPDGAERRVLRRRCHGRGAACLSECARDLLARTCTQMTAADSRIERQPGPRAHDHERDSRGPQRRAGPAAGQRGGRPQADQHTLDRVNALLARIDGLAAKADTQVLGRPRRDPETRATVVQLNAPARPTRAPALKKVDAVLQEAQTIAVNTREGTADLAALRAEAESSLRKVEHLVNEDQPQVAVRARHGDQAAMKRQMTRSHGVCRILLAGGLALLLGACASRSPPLDWQMNAQAAAERAVAAYLAGKHPGRSPGVRAHAP